MPRELSLLERMQQPLTFEERRRVREYGARLVRAAAAARQAVTEVADEPTPPFNRGSTREFIELIEQGHPITASFIIPEGYHPGDRIEVDLDPSNYRATPKLNTIEATIEYSGPRPTAWERILEDDEL